MVQTRVFTLLCCFILLSCSPEGSSNNVNNSNNSSCPAGEITCDGTCVSSLTDTRNCGSCGFSCGFNQICVNGGCVLSCQGGDSECNGECVDLQNDSSHCGTCEIACGPNESCTEGLCGTDTCHESISEAEEGVLPADIIVVVDNSGTMGDEAGFVQEAMHDFVTTITGSGIDTHVILISADNSMDTGICIPSPIGSGSCPGDENLPGFRHVVQEVGSTNALELILNTYAQWAPSLRPDATKSFMVITDDNSGLGAIEFTNQLLALDPTFEGFKFSAIIAPYEVDNGDCLLCEVMDTCNTTSCDTCCGTDTLLGLLCTPLPASEGTVYRDLISATGGIEGNLCTQDFQPAFSDLATAVIWESEVECVYDIPEPPEGEVIDYSKINVDYQITASDDPQAIFHVPGGFDDCGVNGGWYYDAGAPPSQVILCPATCETVTANLSAVISVKFGCATVVQ